LAPVTTAVRPDNPGMLASVQGRPPSARSWVIAIDLFRTGM
jgi:hypothetical protein